MGGSAPAYYWDTCVFVELFNGFKAQPSHQHDIEHFRERADDGKIVILTSILTIGEITDDKLTAEEYKMLIRFMEASVEVKGADIGVMRKVKEIRDLQNSLIRRGQEHRICTPDAIHLATAAIFDCVEFHTFDKRNKNGCSGLIKLDASALGLPFRIAPPEAPAPPRSAAMDLFEIPPAL